MTSKPIRLNFRNVASKTLSQSLVNADPFLQYLHVTKQLEHQAQTRISAVLKTCSYFDLMQNHSSEMKPYSNFYYIGNPLCQGNNSLNNCKITTVNEDQGTSAVINAPNFIKIAEQNKLVKSN